jgi:hypothetical protein
MREVMQSTNHPSPLSAYNFFRQPGSITYFRKDGQLPDYVVIFGKNNVPDKIIVVFEPLKDEIQFHLRRGQLFQLQSDASEKVRQTHQKVTEFIKHGILTPVTDDELAAAQARESLLSEEQSTRQKKSVAPADKKSSASSKLLTQKVALLVNKMDGDLTYLNDIKSRNQQPGRRKRNIINKNLFDAGQFTHKELTTRVTAITTLLAGFTQQKQVSNSDMAPVKYNKLARAQDSNFNRVTAQYTIPRGSNPIGNPLGTHFDLPREYKPCLETFNRDPGQCKIVAHNEVARVVRLSFFNEHPDSQEKVRLPDTGAAFKVL